jgi:hypothetical protein
MCTGERVVFALVRLCGMGCVWSCLVHVVACGGVLDWRRLVWGCVPGKGLCERSSRLGPWVCLLFCAQPPPPPVRCVWVPCWVASHKRQGRRRLRVGPRVSLNPPSARPQVRSPNRTHEPSRLPLTTPRSALRHAMCMSQCCRHRATGLAVRVCDIFQGTQRCVYLLCMLCVLSRGCRCGCGTSPGASHRVPRGVHHCVPQRGGAPVSSRRRPCRARGYHATGTGWWR